MEVRCYAVGAYQTNCYFVGDEDSRSGCMIDPGDEGAYLVEMWKEFGYNLDGILLTHGHSDHTTGLPEVLAAYPGTTVYIHQKDVCESGDPAFYQTAHLDNMKYIKEGDIITFGDIVFTVLETPGHTPGSVVFKCRQAMFTGDTLFAGACGRVDFPGGDWNQMAESLRRLAELPGDCPVHPGHEGMSTLEKERTRNPYIKFAQAQKRT